MIDTLFRSAIPLVLAKLAEVSTADKLYYAAFLSDLADAYLENRREDFAVLLSQMTFPPDTQKQIVTALWAGEPVK